MNVLWLVTEHTGSFMFKRELQFAGLSRHNMLTEIIKGIMKQTTYFKKNILSRVLINLFKPVVHF